MTGTLWRGLCHLRDVMWHSRLRVMPIIGAPPARFPGILSRHDRVVSIARDFQHWWLSRAWPRLQVVANRSPTTYRVRARTTREGRVVADVADQTIAFDASWAAEPSGLPGPAELLAAAFAACLLKNLERAGSLLNFRFENAEVDVTARRQNVPPKFVEIAYELRIGTDETERRVDLVHLNLRKFGTVFNTLAAACDVHGEVLAVPTIAAATPSLATAAEVLSSK